MFGNQPNDAMQTFLQGVFKLAFGVLVGLNRDKRSQAHMSADATFGNGDDGSGMFFFGSSKTVGMRILHELVTLYEQKAQDGTISDEQKYTLDYVRECDDYKEHLAALKAKAESEAYFAAAHSDDVTPEAEQSVSEMLASLGMCGKAN